MSYEMALITQQGICGGKGALSDRVHSMLIWANRNLRLVANSERPDGWILLVEVGVVGQLVDVEVVLLPVSAKGEALSWSLPTKYSWTYLFDAPHAQQAHFCDSMITSFKQVSGWIIGPIYSKHQWGFQDGWDPKGGVLVIPSILGVISVPVIYWSCMNIFVSPRNHGRVVEWVACRATGF